MFNYPIYHPVSCPRANLLKSLEPQPETWNINTFCPLGFDFPMLASLKQNISYSSQLE